MKMTADQLLKIAGITPSTTLRTRLSESVGTARRRRPHLSEAADVGAVYISDDGRVRSVSASEVAGYIDGVKSKKTPAGTVYRASEYWIIVPTAGGSGAIWIEYDGRTNAMSASEVADYTKRAKGTKAKTTPAGTVYTGDEHFVFIPAGSVKEGMERKSDSLEYQFGALGKAVEDQIFTMVDVLLDEEESDPSTVDVEDILNRVAEDIADMAKTALAQPAARRAVTKALGQNAQTYDDEGRMSPQRRLDV